MLDLLSQLFSRPKAQTLLVLSNGEIIRAEEEARVTFQVEFPATAVPAGLDGQALMRATIYRLGIPTSQIVIATMEGLEPEILGLLTIGVQEKRATELVFPMSAALIAIGGSVLKFSIVHGRSL